MKKISRIIILFILVTITLYFIATLIVPKMLDKKFNVVTIASPYQISNEASIIYNSLEFISDLHSDALLWDRDLLVKNDYGMVDIPRMLNSNIALQGFTIVTKAPKNINFDHNKDDSDQITMPYILQGRPIHSWFNLFERAITQCKALHQFEEKSKGKFRIIKSLSGFNKYLKDRKNNKEITAGFLGIEGMHALNGEIENIDKMYEAGVRMMAPVHFFDNKLGGSAHGVSKKGLSEFGKEVIKKMEQKKMIIDLAHSSPKMIDDILSIVKVPVVTSHTGVKGTCNSPRNLSDDHLKKIAKSKGLIGIGMFKGATCDNTIASTVKAIKYCIDLVGADYVALGSDFDGATETHTDITGLPLYVEEMIKNSISKEQIEKVMGGNVKRFLLNNLE
jgi:microsomal dipeptidase-like Zn-dependent dipeptidase